MKVVIPTAGVGGRLGELTSHYNKAMVAIGKRPVISHIMDAYPLDTEFVIALGYKGDYIRQYMELAYPKTKITFVDVDNYDGPGSGPGYSLKLCKPYLDDEFIFHANDTIFIDKLLKLPMEADTMFLSKEKPDPKKYRTVSIDPSTHKVMQIYDKTETPLPNVYDYIGVAYIKDYKRFAEILEDISVRIGESDYFMRILETGIKAHFVDKWYDIGNIEQLRVALDELSDFGNLSKPEESIYFKGTRVFKFSIDESFIQKRVERATILSGLVPDIVASSKNFYAYDYIPGELLSEEISVLPDFKQLLVWSTQKLWKPIDLNKREQNEFENSCFSFYYDKTMNRVDMFYSLYDFKDVAEVINGTQTAELSQLLEMVDWSDLKRGIPVLCHGDYHFENILRTETTFKLLDWRQGFGDEIRYGDLYYDLGKLLHGLIANHAIIRQGLFTVQHEKEEVAFDFHRKQSLIDCEKYFEEFVTKQGWSWDRVRIVTALIYLNIAALHRYPYSHLLYYLGKSMLWQILSDEGGKAPA